MDEPVLLVSNDSCEPIADVRLLTHEEWLEERRKGLGGSEAGAIINLNNYATPIMVVGDKLNLLPPWDDNDYMKHGRRMEPVIRSWVPDLMQEKSPVPITASVSPWMYRSKQYPWMLANIDGLLTFPEPWRDDVGRELSGLIGLEIKTASPWQKKDWDNDSVPDSYYAQVQHYMAVLGLDFFVVIVLLGHILDFRIVPRNNEFIDILVHAEKDLWDNFVLKRLLPAPSGGDREDEFLNGLYEDGTLPFKMVEHLETEASEYLQLNEQSKVIKERKDFLKAQFKFNLGNSEVGLTTTHKITWSRFETTSFDMEAFKKEQPLLFQQYNKKVPGSKILVKQRR